MLRCQRLINKVLSPGDQRCREEAGIPQTLHYTSAHVSKHFFVVTGRVLLCLVDARHAAAHPQFPKGLKSSVSSAEFKKP